MITHAMLQSLGACTKQAEKFLELFGEKGVRPTPELCILHAADFDWDWIANKALTPAGEATYEAATAPAWATYQAATATARATYEAAIAAARATYQAATATALATYQAAKAEAFGTIWCQENP
jgi:hypothetical protein